MALQNIPGLYLPILPNPFWANTAAATATMDAAGESLTAIGKIALSSGPGTSKTISSAGGKVYWVPGTNTFANAGSNLRIGVQDVTGGSNLEDGTFDVQADLVGGTDTITAAVLVGTAMESGTKTIAHGDLVAISIELTARGGADSVTARYAGHIVDLPDNYVTIDTGSGPAVAVASGLVALGFDDGTIGWFTPTCPALINSQAPTTATNPDEYATVFQVPFPTTCVGICVNLDNIASADTFEVILYSDPAGTPVAERTVTVSPTAVSAATADGYFTFLFTSAYTLAANTKYAVAFRPTSANAITIFTMEFGTGNSALRVTTPLGTSWAQGTRQNQTGAFTESDIILPMIGPIFGAFDDGAGSGGGLLRHPGMSGGLV